MKILVSINYTNYSLESALYGISGALAAPRAAKRSPILSIGKEKKTHEWIFSWLSWLAVLLVAAKHQIYQTCSLGLACTSLILDIHVMLN